MAQPSALKPSLPQAGGLFLEEGEGHRLHWMGPRTREQGRDVAVATAAGGSWRAAPSLGPPRGSLWPGLPGRLGPGCPLHSHPAPPSLSEKERGP